MSPSRWRLIWSLNQQRLGYTALPRNTRFDYNSGEMSAHHYFRDFVYCDSGMVPWLPVTEPLSTAGKTLSQLVGERIAKYLCSDEINYTVKDTSAAIARVKNTFVGHADLKGIYDVNRLTMEFEQWRFNLRASNTEPLLRLNVETNGYASQIAERVTDIESIIRDGC